MKLIPLLILLVLLAACRHMLTNEELAAKAKRVHNALVHAKSLPPQFVNTGQPEKDAYGYRNYLYTSVRDFHHMPDTLKIQLAVSDADHGYEHIDFMETHAHGEGSTKRMAGCEGVCYIYFLNRDGMIDWAYHTNPVSKEHPAQNTGTGKSLITKNPPVMEINLSSTAPDSLNTPDKKTIAKYNEKVNATLDELESMLAEK